MLRRVSAAAALALLPALAAAAEPALALQVQRVEERRFRVEGHELWLVLDHSSRTAFADWTRRHVGQRVQLLVDGDLLVEAGLMSPIADGTIVLHTGTERFGAIQTVLSHGKGRVSAVAVP